MKKQGIILILISLLYMSCKEVNRTETLLYKIEELRSKNDSLQRQILKTKDQKDSLGTSDDISSNYWFDNNYNASEFKKYGIEDPESFIKNQLRKRTDLIPLKGVLGGKMQFGRIQVLGNKWLIAEYEDGHIYGKSLYVYSFENASEVEFKLLDSFNP